MIEKIMSKLGMVVFAMIGLAIQYGMQMAFGFRAADDILGAVVNILIYTPCFSLDRKSVGRERV